MTIRLLDPPLHEFLPSLEVARGRSGCGAGQGAARGQPDAGHPRLPAGHPVSGDLRDAGARDRARRRSRVEGARVEIMHPLVVFAEELRRLRALTERVIDEEGGDRPAHPHRHHGRGAARGAPGRPDRASRRLLLVRHQRPHPDGARVLPRRCRGQVPDRVPRGRRACAQPVRDDGRRGAARWSRSAVAAGALGAPDIKLGICGEHGGDPDSIAFCHSAGLDYVSCSPYRVPIARLAAAQAVLSAG